MATNTPTSGAPTDDTTTTASDPLITYATQAGFDPGFVAHMRTQGFGDSYLKGLVDTQVMGNSSADPDLRALARQGNSANGMAALSTAFAPEADSAQAQNSESDTPPDTSYWSAARYGLRNAMRGVGSTLDHLGAHSAGQWLENEAPDAPKNYQPASTGAGTALRQGHWLDAAEYLPRMAIESAPDLAGATAAGAAGGALAGPVGAAAGAASYGEARYLGNNLDDARAANNGADPTTGEVASSAALAGFRGILDRIGVTGIPAVARGATSALDAGATLGVRAVKRLGDAWDDMSFGDRLTASMLVSNYLHRNEDHQNNSRHPAFWVHRWFDGLGGGGEDGE